MKRLFMNRYAKELVQAGTAAASLYLAFQIRFEGALPDPYPSRMLRMLLAAAVLRFAATFLFGLSSQKWRFTTVNDAPRISAAQVPPTLAFLALRLSFTDDHWFVLPLGVIAVDLLLSLTAALGLRMLWRVVWERFWGSRPSRQRRKLLLIGAGYHGAMIANELTQYKGVTVVGFLDDDPDKLGASIAGSKVLGTTEALDSTIQKHGVDDVLVCIPPAGRNGLKLKPAGNGTARVTFMPTVEDVLQSDWASVQPAHRNPAHPHRPQARQREPHPISPVSNRKILITGGAGFIGSSLAARLAPRNELVLLDLTFRDKPLGFNDVEQWPSVKLVKGDILDESLLSSIVSDVDIVIHTAAVLGVSRVCSAARDTLETNYVGTSRLLHALEKNKNLERFVYFSTSEVFGINSYRVTEDTPSSIGSSTEARWSYAIAKVAGEHLVRSYYRDVGTPVVIVRPFNVFGPRRTGDYALLRFIASALRDTPLVVHGDGSQIRAWCFIEDFCDAILAMLERPLAAGEDFNIGNPANTVTVHELARRVIDLAGSSSPIAFVENPFPDISIRVPCLAKAEKILDYKPQFDLDTGLNLTIEWYRTTYARELEAFRKQEIDRDFAGSVAS